MLRFGGKDTSSAGNTWSHILSTRMHAQESVYCTYDCNISTFILNLLSSIVPLVVKH